MRGVRGLAGGNGVEDLDRDGVLGESKAVVELDFVILRVFASTERGALYFFTTDLASLLDWRAVDTLRDALLPTRVSRLLCMLCSFPLGLQAAIIYMYRVYTSSW